MIVILQTDRERSAMFDSVSLFLKIPGKSRRRRINIYPRNYRSMERRCTLWKELCSYLTDQTIRFGAVRGS